MRLDAYDRHKLDSPEEGEERTIKVRLSIVLDDKKHVDDVVKEVTSVLMFPDIKVVEEDGVWILRVCGEFTTHLSINWDEEDAAREAAGTIKHSAYLKENRLIPENVEVVYDN